MPSSRSSSRQSLERRSASGMPWWQKMLLAFGLPAIGLVLILLLVASGHYKIDTAFFFGNLPKVLIGTAALGLGAGMLWVRFGPYGASLNTSSRIAAVILAVASILAGLYIVAPPDWLRLLDAAFLWIGKTVGGWFK